MQQEPPLYNLDNLSSFGDKDNGLAREIITIFLEQLPAYITALTEGCSNKDWKAVAFTAHKLKSNIRLFNISRALDDILQIESDAKNLSNLDQVNDKIVRVMAILQRVEQEMQQAIQK